MSEVLSEMLKITEVATRLSVAPVTIRRLINAGELSANRVGRVIRVSSDSVEAFLHSSATSSCADSPADDEQHRLAQLDFAVRNYLSHVWACEQGADDDGTSADYWRDEMARLTGGNDE